MTSYVTVPNGDIDVDSPVTTDLVTALRDNPIAIAEGSSGSPNIRVKGQTRLLFDASTTHVVPSGVTEVWYEIFAGGGGGSGSNTANSITANATNGGNSVIVSTAVTVTAAGGIGGAFINNATATSRPAVAHSSGTNGDINILGGGGVGGIGGLVEGALLGDTYVGSDGSNGGYCSGSLVSVPAETLTITIGSGGAKGTSSGGAGVTHADGSDGGDGYIIIRY